METLSTGAAPIDGVPRFIKGTPELELARFEIKAAMKIQKKTVADLVRITDLDHASISRFLNPRGTKYSKGKNTSYETVARVQRALGIR